MNWRSRGIATAGVTLAMCVVIGLAAGAIWQAVAPRPTLVTYSGGVGFESVADSGAAMSLSLGVILAAAGIVSGLVAVALFRDHPRAVLIAVFFGGIVGSLVAWRFAEFLTPGPHEVTAELADGLASGTTFQSPLVLNTYGVLGLWSLTAAIVLAIANGVRTRRMRRAYAQTWAQTYPESVAS